MMMPSIFGENLFDDFMEDAFKSPIFGKREKNLMKTVFILSDIGLHQILFPFPEDRALESILHKVVK